MGNGTTTSRDAIGARIEVVLADGGRKKLVKTLRAGEGFLAQSSKWIHFGSGDAESIEKVIVRWPAGDIEPFTSVDVDCRYQLVQGSGRAWKLPPTERSLALAASALELPPPSGKARIPMVTLLLRAEAGLQGI